MNPSRTLAVLSYLVLAGYTYGSTSDDPSGGGAEAAVLPQLEFEAPSKATADPGVVGVGVTVHEPSCTGVPFRGTNLVVTATHCVVFAATDGTRVKGVQISREGELVATGVRLLIDTRYLLNQAPAYDLAIIETDSVFSYGVDAFGAEPTEDWVAYGLQRIGLDGRRLAADEPAPQVCDVFDCSSEPELRRHQERVELVEQRVATCEGTLDSVTPRDDGAVTIDCGFVPGGSGGPVVVYSADRVKLVGVISTVSGDLTRNGVTPAQRIEDLLTGAQYVMSIAIGADRETPATPSASGADAAERSARDRQSALLLDRLRDTSDP